MAGALVTGGYDGSSYLNTVELYMPRQGRSCKESDPRYFTSDLRPHST